MADRYWVGGSGNWTAGVGPTDTLHWSATAGGPGGASTPTELDNVFFLPGSGSNYTVTLASTACKCANLSIQSPTTGTLTFVASGTTVRLYVCGSWTSTNVRVSWSSSVVMSDIFLFGATGTVPMSFGGLSPVATNVTIGGTYLSGGSTTGNFVFDSSVSFGSAALFLNYGVLDISGGYTLTAFRFSSSSNVNVRSIAFGSAGKLVLTGNNTTVVDFTSMINFSFTGTSRVELTYAGNVGTRTIAMWVSATEAQTLNYYITAGSDIISWSGLAARSLNFTGFSGSVTYPGTNPTVYGNVVLSNAMSLASGTGRSIFFKTTDSGNTYSVTSGGKSWPYYVTFSQGNWKLNDNMAITDPMYMQLGVLLDIGNNVLSTPLLWSGSLSAYRGINFNTSGRVDLTGNSTTILPWATSTNFTCLGNHNFRLTYSGNTGTRTLQVGTSTGGSANGAPNITFTGNATDTVDLQGHYGNISFANFNGTVNHGATTYVYGNYINVPTVTHADGSGTTVFTGPMTANRTIDSANVSLGYPWSFTAANTGTFLFPNNVSFNRSNIQVQFTGGNIIFPNKIWTVGGVYSATTSPIDFDFGNTGGWNIYGSNSTVFSFTYANNKSWLGNSNIQFTGTPSVGNRVITYSTSGANQINSPNIIIQGGTDTINLGGAFNVINWGNFTGTFGGGSYQKLFYSNLTIPANLTGIGSSNFDFGFAGDRDQTFVTNGWPINFPFSVNKTGGTLTLANNLNIANTRTFSLISGNFNANNKNVTLGTLISGNIANARTLIMGNGNWTISGTLSVAVSMNANNLTVVPNSSNIIITSSATHYFNTSPNVNLGNVIFAPVSNIAMLTFQNGCNVASFTATSPNAYTLSFNPAGTPNYIFGNFNVSGASSSNLAKITSMKAPGTFNLVYNGASNVNISNANVSYSNASPATNTWYALTTNNNIDGGNNAGWIFALSAGGSSNFFLVF